MISLRNLKYKLRHKNDKIIFVNPTILLDKLEKTTYGIRQPSGQIGNRVQRAKEFILKNWDDPRAKIFPWFEASVVGMYGNPGMEYVSFEDGRHRVLAAEELGITEVPIEIPRHQEKKFEYMKVKPLNESPDYIKSIQYGYNLQYNDAYSIPFIGHIQNDNSIIVGIGDDQGNHSSVLKTNFEYDNKDKPIFELNYSGRMWTDKKIISFWRYPDKKTFKIIINKLEKMLGLKMWNNNWKIEILTNNNKIIINSHIRFEDGVYKIIPIENYMKSNDFPEELRQKHIMSWDEKEKLRKSSTYPNKQKPLAWKQALYQESVNNVDIKSEFKKDILLPLKRESLKFDNFKDFSNSYSIYGNHGLYFHLTNDPNWIYDSKKGSRDMSSMSGGEILDTGSLMVTSDLENWDYHYNFDEDEKPRTNNTRDYVALIDLGDVKYYIGFGRGFGHELYLYPNEAKKAIILDVLPIKEARKFAEKYKKKQPHSEEQLYKIWKESHSNLNERMIIKFKDFEFNI